MIQYRPRKRHSTIMVRITLCTQYLLTTLRTTCHIPSNLHPSPTACLLHQIEALSTNRTTHYSHNTTTLHLVEEKGWAPNAHGRGEGMGAKCAMLAILLLDGQFLLGLRASLLREVDVKNAVVELHFSLVTITVGWQSQGSLDLTAPSLRHVNRISFRRAHFLSLRFDN